MSARLSTGTRRKLPSILGRDAELALELLAARPAHAQPRAATQLNLVVSTRLAQQRVHELQLHDRRPMDAEEDIGIETFLERLHRFANEVYAVRDIELRVRTARGDVV